jgi:putative CocE/NonD family hydrolase
MLSCSNEIVIDQEWLEAHYSKSEVMIPMRDGIRLYTSVYQPIGSDDRPILIVRTPYSCAPYGDGWKGDLTEYMAEFLKNEYIIVFQDVRGRYMSEGEYMNVRPYDPEKKGNETDEASDTYDTIEWLLQNTDNNGAVGVTGMSYPGFYATLAALSGHPALKAVSPQAPILDWFKGDDVHHNGALMLMDIYSFAPYMFKKHDNPVQEDHGLPSPIGDDAYQWFLDKLTPSELTAALPDTLMFWNEILQHPDYDTYWKERSLEPYLNDIKPAILVVGGSFDTDDCYGALNTYKLIRRNSPGTDLHLVYGPWPHGGWHHVDYEGLGNRKSGKDLSRYFMEKIEYRFFRYYLENKGSRPEPVHLYASGSDEWQILECWPSDDVSYKPLYLCAEDSLSFAHPADAVSSSVYSSDPFSPVPFMADASKRDNSYMVADQTFASNRSDVLTFVSTSQEDALKLQGPVQVRLDLSISSSDADIVVKLIDVHPDGYQMLVRGEVFPVRYRNGFEQPSAAVPGEIMHIDFTMNDVAHWILPGHKIMIQIQSTWFPLVNINPQTFIGNIYEADLEDYRETQVTVYHQKDAASHILLPIVR